MSKFIQLQTGLYVNVDEIMAIRYWEGEWIVITVSQAASSIDSYFNVCGRYVDGVLEYLRQETVDVWGDG